MRNKFLTTAFKVIFLQSVLFFSINNSNAQTGEALFKQNCASCHSLYKKSTGPAIFGAIDRWNGDYKKLRAWIKNPAGFAATDAYAGALLKEYPTVMQAFPSLPDKDIDAILDYIKNLPPPPTETETQTGVVVQESDNSLLYGILTLILAVVALVLLQVNSNLKKLTDEKEGVMRGEPVPFYRNKAYIAFATIILFLLGGYYTIAGAIGLGRTQNYQPEQPIFYSHKVHAGINQINCLYCHGGAQDGKHANIPSVNVCMNCHMAIPEYKGKEKIYDGNGKEVDGTAEIKKLYQYAGWTGIKYNDDANKDGRPDGSKEIEWVRIHNLPDHVYFNHSQHIKAGKVQCQTCHGEIQNMDEVKQFSSLSMGWCVNCHRETNVQFKDNGFYNIYTKFHDEIKKQMDEERSRLIKSGIDPKRISIDTSKYYNVSAEKIGATECQKCHY